MLIRVSMWIKEYVLFTGQNDATTTSSDGAACREVRNRNHAVGAGNADAALKSNWWIATIIQQKKRHVKFIQFAVNAEGCLLFTEINTIYYPGGESICW